MNRLTFDRLKFKALFVHADRMEWGKYFFFPANVLAFPSFSVTLKYTDCITRIIMFYDLLFSFAGSRI